MHPENADAQSHCRDARVLGSWLYKHQRNIMAPHPYLSFHDIDAIDGRLHDSEKDRILNPL